MPDPTDDTNAALERLAQYPVDRLAQHPKLLGLVFMLMLYTGAVGSAAATGGGAIAGP